MRKFILLVLCTLLIACSDSGLPDASQMEKEEQVKVQPKEQEMTEGELEKYNAFKGILKLIENGAAFDVGSYIKGDIPSGQYIFMPLTIDGGYYSEKDASGDIIDNEIFDAFGYVDVHGIGNIQTDGVLITEGDIVSLGFSSAKELFEVLTEQTDYMGGAYYKVGVDIPAGTYVATSEGDRGYIAVMAGAVGNSDIIENEIFNGRYQVTVQNGQYLKVSSSIISQQ